MARYSHSKISTFETCKLRYRLAYIDRVDSPLEGIEAFMGSRVHEALERLYKDVMIGKVPELLTLEETYEQAWEKNWHESVVIVDESRTAEDYRSLGLRCIRDYYQRYHPFDQAKTLGTEVRLEVPLGGDGEVGMVGIADRLDEKAPGCYEIHDYKTSQRLPTQQEVDGDRQLALYQLAVEGMWPDVERVDLVWHFLVFDKELRSTRTREELEALREECLEVIGQIEAETEFPARQSALCRWCEFRPDCPVFKHEETLEGVSPIEFLADDGVQLVNEYVRLKQQEAELEQKIKDVENAIEAYAADKGVEQLVGSGYRVRIKYYPGVQLPRREDPGRVDLERAVKELGYWDRYSSLDTFKLGKELKEGRTPPDLADAARPFAKETVRRWMRHFPTRSG